MKLGGYETNLAKRAVRAYKEGSVAYMFANTAEGATPSDEVLDASIEAGLSAALGVLHGQVSPDTTRLDLLERQQRLAEIVVDGKVTPCTVYAVSGVPGAKLREILDAMLAVERV